MSLKDKNLRNDDYFLIIASSSYPLIVDRARCKWNGGSAVQVNKENERFTIVVTIKLKPSIWKFLVVIWQSTSNNSTYVHAVQYYYFS